LQQAVTLASRPVFYVGGEINGSRPFFCPSHIARPEVALVVLAIRWSSHSFGDVKLFCDKYGKPLVRLPAGYNSNQVAAQVLAQCSTRLGAK